MIRVLVSFSYFSSRKKVFPVPWWWCRRKLNRLPVPYCRWKKSFTTWDVQNLVNVGINYLSAGERQISSINSSFQFFPTTFQLRWDRLQHVTTTFLEMFVDNKSGKSMVGRQSFRFGTLSCQNQLRALSFREGKGSLSYTYVWRGKRGKIWAGWVLFVFFAPSISLLLRGFRTFTPWTMCKLGCCLNIPKAISPKNHQLPKTPQHIWP